MSPGFDICILLKKWHYSMAPNPIFFELKKVLPEPYNKGIEKQKNSSCDKCKKRREGICSLKVRKKKRKNRMNF
jgi:hypothetical protein